MNRLESYSKNFPTTPAEEKKPIVLPREIMIKIFEFRGPIYEPFLSSRSINLIPRSDLKYRTLFHIFKGCFLLGKLGVISSICSFISRSYLMHFANDSKCPYDSKELTSDCLDREMLRYAEAFGGGFLIFSSIIATEYIFKDLYEKFFLGGVGELFEKLEKLCVDSGLELAVRIDNSFGTGLNSEHQYYKKRVKAIAFYFKLVKDGDIKRDPYHEKMIGIFLKEWEKKIGY